jgi:hypothetical protein
MTDKKAKKAPAKASSPELAKARTLLSTFQKNNPSAKVDEAGNPPFRYVDQPWGDRSLALVLPPDEPEPFIDTLNGLIFPDRLSAVYHLSSKRLEVNFTAYKLPDPLQDLPGRTFQFGFRNQVHTCSFDAASDELLLIARHAVFLEATSTGFRNLQSLSAFARRNPEDDKKPRSPSQQFGEPVSFYISDIEWDEEITLEVLRHINFYLTYYDNLCPYIIIHPPTDETVVKPRTRFIQDERFPDKISSRELNPILLQFWIAAAEADTSTKYLLYYRILEFVTTYYLTHDKLAAVKKVLAAPNISDTLSTAVDQLVGLLREERPDSHARFTKMINDLVSADLMWREICANPKAFTEAVSFDGGLELEALVADIANRSSFGPQGMLSLARIFRKIRNALAHGGEAQSGEVILPTAKNLKKLQPWVHLIAVAAGEVVLFEHLT